MFKPLLLYAALFHVFSHHLCSQEVFEVGIFSKDSLRGLSIRGKRLSFQLLTDVVGLRSWRTKSDSFWLVLDEVVSLGWLFVLKWNSLGMVTASTLFSGSRSTMRVQKINAGELTWAVALRYLYKHLKRESSHIDPIVMLPCQQSVQYLSTHCQPELLCSWPHSSYVVGPLPSGGFWCVQAPLLQNY